MKKIARLLMIFSLLWLHGHAAMGDELDNQNRANLLNNSFYIVHTQTGKALDSNTKGAVYCGGKNLGMYQRWQFKEMGDCFLIEDLATGRFLSSNSEGKLTTLPEVFHFFPFIGNNLFWKIRKDNENYIFQNRETGRILSFENSNFWTIEGVYHQNSIINNNRLKPVV